MIQNNIKQIENDNNSFMSIKSETLKIGFINNTFFTRIKDLFDLKILVKSHSCQKRK